MSGEDEGTSRAHLQYIEAVMPGLNLSMDLKRILASEQSEYQKVEILETFFGKVSEQEDKGKSLTDGRTLEYAYYLHVRAL